MVSIPSYSTNDLLLYQFAGSRYPFISLKVLDQHHLLLPELVSLIIHSLRMHVKKTLATLQERFQTLP